MRQGVDGAARRYAQAFVTLVHRQGQLEPALNDLAAIQQLLERHAPLARLLENPEVESAEKQALLTRVLETRVSPMALRLVLLLLWKGRLPWLSLVVTEARRLRDEVEGIARGAVRSARPLPPAVLAALTRRLEHRLGKRVVLTSSTDPSLLGGLSVQVDTQVLDGSVRRALELLGERLRAIRLT